MKQRTTTAEAWAALAAGKRRCPVCSCYFYPRNWRRHVVACTVQARRTKEATR